MNPNTLLAYLIAGASIVGAKFHADHEARKKPVEQSSGKLSQLEKEIEILKAENETLKKLQGLGGEVVLPIELYTYVEKNLGLEFFPHVKAFSSSEEKLTEAAEHRWISQFGSEGMDKRNYVFQLLGILPVNQNYSKQLALAETSGAIGYYDVSAKELLLSERYDPENVFHQASLIRLLSIALLEQHYPAKENLTDDAFIARDAVIRGKASMVSHRFQNNYTRSGHIKAGSDAENTEAIELFKSLPPLVQGITTFPVKYGKGYVEYLTLNHDSLFPQLFTHPPTSTALIFANKLPVSPATTTETNTKKSQPLLTTSLGQAMTSFYIQQIKDDSSLLHLSLTEDELTLNESPEAFSSSWKTVWSDAASATEFYKIASEISAIMEAPCEVVIDGNQVVLKQIVTK